MKNKSKKKQTKEKNKNNKLKKSTRTHRARVHVRSQVDEHVHAGWATSSPWCEWSAAVRGGRQGGARHASGEQLDERRGHEPSGDASQTSPVVASRQMWRARSGRRESRVGT